MRFRSLTVLGSLWLVIMCFILICNDIVVKCDPPREPIVCSSGNSNCTVSSYLGSFPDRSTCRAADVVYPENEAQLIAHVRNATKMKRKIKVASRYIHSATKLMCPDGVDGLIISTKNLSKVISVNVAEKTITVESGMTLKKFIDEAAKMNLALPYSPYWAGVTIGGMLGTGAHGSSLWGLGSAVHDHVVSLKIVSPGEVEDDYVKVRMLNTSDEDLNAAKVSLGVLGVISQVTFKLETLFKRNITFITREDDDLEVEAPKFGIEHEFADIIWLPSQHKAIYRYDDRVPTTTSGNGVYDFLPFRPTPRALLESVRGLEELQESNGLERLRCVSANSAINILKDTAFGLTNNGILFTGYPVIGYQNKMQASAGCLDNSLINGYCGWDPRIDGQFYFTNGFTLSMANVPSFIQDIKKLVDIEPTSLCGLEYYLGILMRYVKASSAYLGKDFDGIDFDITYYRSRTNGSAPRLYEHIIDEIEQMAVFKYGAMPHWGKNRNIAFIGAIDKYKDAGKFLSVKEKYDPLGYFSGEWTDQVLGLKDGLSIDKIGCAREGLCKCNTNNDCGPQYSCVNGLVYTEAKVCKKMRSNNLSINNNEFEFKDNEVQVEDI